MKKRLSKEKVFALRGHTLKVIDGKFHFCETVYFDDKAKWRGPFSSLDGVCKAIAKNTVEEYQRRLKRVAHHQEPDPRCEVSEGQGWGLSHVVHS